MESSFKCSGGITIHRIFMRSYGEHEAVFDVRDLRVLRGTLPRRAMVLVLEWATDHRDELMEDWNLCSQLKSPKPIDPLI